jgi:hypothetical protein
MLNDMIRVGDRVQFRIDPKEDYYRQLGDPSDGKTGVVVARERITMYEERVGLVVRKPGVYEVDGPAIVQWDDGITTQPNGWKIHMLDIEEEKRRYAVRRSEITDDNWVEINGKYENRVFIGELPLTPAWEGDFVRVKRERFGMKESYGVIERIDYYFMRNNQGEAPKYNYRITDEFKKPIGGSTYANVDEVEIIERGNVYKYFNTEPTQFADLREEASFFKWIGRAKEVRNPVSKIYRWTMSEVLQAIRDDIVDCCNLQSMPFSFGRQDLCALRYKDRDLGRRLQAETLAGFKDFRD